MGMSEIVAVMIVYSSLSIYLIVPFRNQQCTKKDNQSKRVTFTGAYRESMKSLLLHKKAILAYLLLILSLAVIWLVFDQEEYYFNAHSGYPPISNDGKAILSMTGLFVYTVILYLFIGFLRALRMVKKRK